MGEVAFLFEGGLIDSFDWGELGDGLLDSEL